MIYDYIRPIVEKADALVATGDVNGAFSVLGELPMADYCEILSHVPGEFRALTSALPTMPPDAAQKQWTGHAGRELLVKSCTLLRLIQDCSLTLRGRGVEGAILDYGCGWGRMCRYISYFGGPDLVYGVDPKDRSLELCALHGVPGTIRKIDPIPETFPVQDVRFDMAFSYSVMTHTPKQVTKGILRTVRSVIAEDGLFASTIRPIEFWEMRRNAFKEHAVNRLIDAHKADGYAYVPIGGGADLEDSLYGDSSYSIDYFDELAFESGWEIAKIDRDVLEPYQITIVLKPV